MTQDPALQRRVEEMQEVVALVRAVPLRESPRNYLLSSAMVSEPKPQPKVRHTPLLLMKLATSLVALAFVVTFGLNVLQSSNLLRGAMSPMTPQFDAQPDEEAAAVSAYDTPVEEETAMVMTESQAPEPLTTQDVEDPAALAAPPLPEELAERVEAGEVLGMGGPIEEEAEISPESRLAEAPKDQAVSVTGEDEEESAVETTLILPEAPAESPPPAEDVRAEVAEEEIRSVQVLEGEPTTTSVWITIGLGLATAILAAITIWMSRRNVG